jgi:hypothetical protein
MLRVGPMQNRTAQMNDRWRKYLRDDEHLLWAGHPELPQQLKRLFLTTVPLGIFGLLAGWYAFSYSDVTEACGDAYARSCFKTYYLAWISSIVCSGIVALSTIRFVAWAAGLITFSYAITDKRVLSLTTGLYRSFRAIYLDLLEPGMNGIRRPFGEVAFELSGTPTLSFCGLNDDQLVAAIFCAQQRKPFP